MMLASPQPSADAAEESGASTWPPPGQVTKLMVTRDAWLSEVSPEATGNNGGASRMKLKGRQEFSLFDVDVSQL